MSRRTARFLSLVLRHAPDRIDLTLGSDGWIATRDLLAALRRHGHPTSPEELAGIVADDDKGRFTLSEDGRRIRAAQSHSVDIDLQLEPTAPRNSSTTARPAGAWMRSSRRA